MRRPLLLLTIALLAAVFAARRRRRRAARRHAPAAPMPAPTSPEPGPAPPGERFVSVPWTLVMADPRRPRLTIRYTADERMELDRVDAQETPTQVFVTVMMRRRAPEEAPVAPARERDAVVSLAHPLDGRELVHTPVDEPSEPPLYP